MFRTVLMNVINRSAPASLRWFQSESKPLPDVLQGLGPKTTSYQYLAIGKKVVEEYSSGDDEAKRDILLNLAVRCGPDRHSINNAILLYSKNPSLAHEVREAATPVHFRLLQSIGNLPDGIKQICDMRANLLRLMKTESDRSAVSALHRLEKSAHELLVIWFCQSNMKLERLMWQSPGDILHKVSEYEAVHPVRGPSDFKNRLGCGRRCFYFSHEAMPREPLVIVHVALLNDIADNVQSIVDSETVDYDEDTCTTAIYYSITSTQPGLAGIDLGNMLIKRVANLLHSELPSIDTHSTLSPIPGFRTWMLRRLRESSLFGSILDDSILKSLSDAFSKSITKDEATEMLIELLTNVIEAKDELEKLKDVLLHCCANYLTSRQQNGFALNPVANFHLRNGAELYRLNWKGDTSARGLKNSLGIMVNYRYRLENVLENSVRYTMEKHIPVHDNVRSLM
ncbi:hypothetical protein Q1695_006235 [Nippostrongylus brasiliensis]|nr:hypothetical protein Q1695_006235 [Nippostrongylus brasiliensis]